MKKLTWNFRSKVTFFCISACHLWAYIAQSSSLVVNSFQLISSIISFHCGQFVAWLGLVAKVLFAIFSLSPIIRYTKLQLISESLHISLYFSANFELISTIIFSCYVLSDFSSFYTALVVNSILINEICSKLAIKAMEVKLS